MRKLLVVHNFYRNYGGEDSNIHEEIKLLNGQFNVKFFEKKNGFNFSFFAILSLITRSNFKVNREFTKVLKDFKPDLVYIHNTWFNINLGIFKILTKRNIGAALKIHNFRYDCSRYFLAKNHLKGNKRCNACGFEYKNSQFINKYFDSSYVKSLVLYFYSLKYFKILKNSKIKIIAVNNFHKIQLIKFGISEDKIRVINNPLNTKNTPVRTKEKNIIYAGRLSKEKGLVELIEAWLEADIKNFNLKIIGDGDLQKELEKKYSSKNVNFLGFLPNETVLEHISKSTAVVTATKLYEGHPRLLSEASALGTLSIYPSFGGMDEFFPENYQFAFEQFNYEDLKNKFILLSDQKIIEEATKRVLLYTQQQLNSKVLIEKFTNVFEERI